MSAADGSSADRGRDELAAALAAADDVSVPASERAEMLAEIAMGLQQRPRQPQDLGYAVELYDRAIALCPPGERLLDARLRARRATALQALPGEESGQLEDARDAYLAAIPAFAELGLPEEVAEAEMNLGLCYQALAGAHRARITDAIAAYQRALRTFDRQRFPREFAILQNNLATAFLSIPFTDTRAKMREAFAVRAFEEGLQIVSLTDHPTEYAMLQNNLGNALQYAASGHTVENQLRALEAYDEALKVRTRDAMPVAYANTIANKANCLANLPDDPARPEAGGSENLARACRCYAEAREIFTAAGELERARLVAEAHDQLQRELLALANEPEPARGSDV